MSVISCSFSSVTSTRGCSRVVIIVSWSLTSFGLMKPVSTSMPSVYSTVSVRSGPSSAKTLPSVPTRIIASASELPISSSLADTAAIHAY